MIGVVSDNFKLSDTWASHWWKFVS